MAPRTLHQAMAYLGLAEQTEPVRENRPRDEYDRVAQDGYDDAHGVVYEFDHHEDGFAEEDYFVDDRGERTSSNGSIREETAEYEEDDYQADRSYSESRSVYSTPSSSRSSASTGSLHIVQRSEEKAKVRSLTPVSDPVNDESDEELRRITTIHPRSYNDAKIIGESFRESIPVIMNVTDMGDSEAKRLVDFSAGLAFALHGSIERVTDKVFLLTPANLEVLGAEGAEVPVALDSETSDLFNQG